MLANRNRIFPRAKAGEKGSKKVTRVKKIGYIQVYISQLQNDLNTLAESVAGRKRAAAPVIAAKKAKIEIERVSAKKASRVVRKKAVLKFKTNGRVNVSRKTGEASFLG